MTFQIQYATKGRSFWPRRRSDALPDRVTANLKYLQALKSQGVNWLGLTVSDEAYELGTGRDDFFSFFQTLELGLALGFRINVRTHPMVHTSRRLVDNPDEALNEFYGPFSALMKPYDPKKVMWTLMPEPALTARVSSEGAILAPSYAEFIERLPTETAKLEDFLSHQMKHLRIDLPLTTFGLSSPGWSHLLPNGDVYEYDLMGKSADSNIVRCHDFYFEVDPLPFLNRAYKKYAAQGEKLMLGEYGSTPLLESRMEGWCKSYRVPYAKWQLN